MKTLLILLLSISPSFAQKVISVNWASQATSPPTQLEHTNPKFAQLLRFSLKSLPEPVLMQLAGYGGAKLGLNQQQAKTLQAAIANYYQKMTLQVRKHSFPPIPSALSYCYSRKKPSHGLATVYIPKMVTEHTRTILFLHGYGGSFSLYLHYLATCFPDSIIICPAYGMSMAKVPNKYLHGCLKAVKARLKHTPAESNLPTLMGLSAGGTGGFRHYARNAHLYERFICIASLPPRGIAKPFPKNSRIRVIAGGDESYVKSKLLERRTKQLKIKNYQQAIIKDQGHFFLLTDELKTKKWLHWYMEN